MLHPVPAVPRAVSRRRRFPRPWLPIVPLALVASASVALAWPVAVAHGVENVLSDPSVSPGTGTTQTSFTLSVHYTSSAGQVANRVFAVSSGWSIDLELASGGGTTTDGTWVGVRTLPAGTWPVEFRAESQGRPPVPVAGPTVTVLSPPTPTPVVTPSASPSASPTAVPTLPPTPVPTATPAGTPSPPATPAPTPRRTASPRPTSAVSSSGVPVESASAVTATPAGSATEGQSSAGPTASAVESVGTESPSSTASPGPGDEAVPAGSLRGPLLVIGGGLTATGALVLGAQYVRVRHRRRGSP